MVPRYAAAEAGLLGAGCANRTASDDMHLYTDRVAVIPGSPCSRDGDTVPCSSALCPFIQAKYFLTPISAIRRG